MPESIGSPMLPLMEDIDGEEEHQQVQQQEDQREHQQELQH